MNERFDGERFWYLSPRQWQVLDLVATGMAQKEIAVELGCSLQSVKNHLSHIFQRLDVSGSIAALRKAGYIVDRGTSRRRTDDIRLELARLNDELVAFEQRVVDLRGQLVEVLDDEIA